MKSLLEFSMEYYDNFIVVIPRRTIKWRPNHKIAETNKYVIATKQEIKKILSYFKKFNQKYYLIFKIITETGMRKGELININYDKVYIKERYIDTHGKTGRKIYYISSNLAYQLKEYIIQEEKNRIRSKALFISSHKKRYSERAFNLQLKRILKKLNIEKNISCHTFRKSLNTFRKLINCPTEDRKILINHKTSDVNIDSYIILNYKQYIKLFDKWNPYKTLKF